MSASELTRAGKALAKRGSSKGGKARAKKLSPLRRREIAQAAGLASAAARLKKKK